MHHAISGGFTASNASASHPPADAHSSPSGGTARPARLPSSPIMARSAAQSSARASSPEAPRPQGVAPPSRGSRVFQAFAEASAAGHSAAKLQIESAVKELAQAGRMPAGASLPLASPPLPDGTQLQRVAPPSRDSGLFQAYAELSAAASQAGQSQARIFHAGAQETLAGLGDALQRTVHGQGLPEADKQALVDHARMQNWAWEALGHKHSRGSGRTGPDAADTASSPTP